MACTNWAEMGNDTALEQVGVNSARYIYEIYNSSLIHRIKQIMALAQ